MPVACFYPGSATDPATDATQLKAVLTKVLAGRRPPPVDPADLPTWDRVAGDYHERIQRLA